MHYTKIWEAWSPILDPFFSFYPFFFGRRKTSTIETICDRSVCHMHLATASTNRRTEKWRWQLWTEKKDFKVARFSGFFISFFLIFKFFCSPSLPRVSGSRKDVKHGSKVKGNTKTELMMMRMMMRMGAAGTPHPPTHNTFIVLYQSKYHCSIAYLDIFSLAVTLQQWGSPSLYVLLFYFFVFSLSWMGGPNPNPNPRLPACQPVW